MSVRDTARGIRSPSLKRPRLVVARSTGHHRLTRSAALAPRFGGSGNGFSVSGPRPARTRAFAGGVIDAASECNLGDCSGGVSSPEDCLDETREKLGRRTLLPLLETALEGRVVVLKRSGTMIAQKSGIIVAISGLKGGILPVMIHNPVSATDQLK